MNRLLPHLLCESLHIDARNFLLPRAIFWNSKLCYSFSFNFHQDECIPMSSKLCLHFSIFHVICNIPLCCDLWTYTFHLFSSRIKKNACYRFFNFRTFLYMTETETKWRFNEKNPMMSKPFPTYLDGMQEWRFIKWRVNEVYLYFTYFGLAWWALSHFSR